MAVEYVKWDDPRVEYKDENEDKDITAVANVRRTYDPSWHSGGTLTVSR